VGCQDQRNSDSPSTLRLVRVQLDRIRSLNERIDALHDDLIQLSREVEMLRHIDDDAQRDAAVSDSYEDQSAAKMTRSDVERMAKHVRSMEQTRSRLVTKRDRLIRKLVDE